MTTKFTVTIKDDSLAEWLDNQTMATGLSMNQLALNAFECFRQYVENLGGGSLCLPVNVVELADVRRILKEAEGPEHEEPHAA